MTTPKKRSLQPAADTLSPELFAADAATGLEGLDKDSVAIPFLRILQSNSPQCTEGEPEYLPDARPGQIHDTVHQTLWSGQDGVLLLPCSYRRRFFLFAPRGSGGLLGEYTPEQVEELRPRLAQDGARLYLPEDPQSWSPKTAPRLVDTRMHFVLVLTEDGPRRALLSLSSTQIRKSKQLMALLSSVRIGNLTPPTWMTRVRLTTTTESNDQGTWRGARFTAEGQLTDAALYEEAKAFHALVAEDRVSYETPAEEQPERF